MAAGLEFAESRRMRKITREKAIELGLSPATWDRVHALRKNDTRRLVLPHAVDLLRRVAALERKYGPIRIK